jgi:hypothetical protein
MDVIELKEEYGDQMAYMGGIDVRLMNLEDPEPLEKEIREKVSAAKVGAGTCTTATTVSPTPLVSRTIGG